MSTRGSQPIHFLSVRTCCTCDQCKGSVGVKLRWSDTVGAHVVARVAPGVEERCTTHIRKGDVVVSIQLPAMFLSWHIAPHILYTYTYGKEMSWWQVTAPCLVFISAHSVMSCPSVLLCVRRIEISENSVMDSYIPYVIDSHARSS